MMDAQKEENETSVEDNTNSKNQQRKRGRPRKSVKDDSNSEKNEKHRSLNDIEKEEVEESVCCERVVDPKEVAVASAPHPVKIIRRRRRKSTPMRAAV
jgi:hypothetical protein